MYLLSIYLLSPLRGISKTNHRYLVWAQKIWKPQGPVRGFGICLWVWTSIRPFANVSKQMTKLGPKITSRCVTLDLPSNAPHVQRRSPELKGLGSPPPSQSPNKPVKYKGTEIPRDPCSKTTQKTWGLHHKSSPPPPVRGFVSPSDREQRILEKNKNNSQAGILLLFFLKFRKVSVDWTWSDPAICKWSVWHRTL